MNVTLCSAFRDSASYLADYLLQVARLGNALDGHLHLILCEGDSSDDTYCRLQSASKIGAELGCFTVDLFQHCHGGPRYGSVVNTERFRQLAGVWNAIWARIPADADAVVFVESDLRWQPQTIAALLDRLGTYPAVAPKILYPTFGPGFFWDTWAFRKDGRCFAHNPPYFSDLHDDPPSPCLVQLDSAGSCIVMRGDLARQLTWPEKDVCIGLSRQIYELGASIWLDTEQKVIHP